jgi:O-antigen/teichoic acid export membrane protein
MARQENPDDEVSRPPAIPSSRTRRSPPIAEMNIPETDKQAIEATGGGGAQRQIRDSLLYMLPLVISNLIPVLTLPIFTRILTKEDYGVLALAQVYAVLVSGLANLGMSLSYERNYFQYRKSRRDSAGLLFSCLVFVLFNITIAGIFTFFFRERLSAWIIGFPGFGDILFYAFLNNCAMNLVTYYQTSLRNAGEVVPYLRYTVTISLLNLGLSLYFVIIARTGVIGLVVAPLIANGVMFILLTWRFVKAWSFALSWPLFLESLKISYPLTPRIFLGAVSQQFDKYLIGLLSTLGGVGVYRIGQQVASLVFSYMTQLEHVFIPGTYRRMFDLNEGGKEAVGRYLTPFFYVSIAVALMICLFSEEVISILTPPAFHGAIDIVNVLSMFYGFLFFGKITGTQLIFMKKTHITSLLSFSTIAINIALNIPCIMMWGTIGAAWGTMISGILSCSISFAVAQHYYGVRWEYGKIIPVLALFFASALLTLALRGYADYPVRLLAKLLFMGIFIYTGVRIRVITTENLATLKDIAAAWIWPFQDAGKKPGHHIPPC